MPRRRCWAEAEESLAEEKESAAEEAPATEKNTAEKSTKAKAEKETADEDSADTQKEEAAEGRCRAMPSKAKTKLQPKPKAGGAQGKHNGRRRYGYSCHRKIY
ncbi:MAG: hypothetical protein U5L96_19830 [Owenweeksia sp.]|nr:hypothetical protein [Owenweeksia sp.]